MLKKYKVSWNTRTVVFLGLMIAVQIVLSRLFVLDMGPWRISFGPVSTMLTGLWFGPVYGAICGLAADLLGCLLKGYAINPLITLSAMTWGIIPAVIFMLTAKAAGSRTKKTVFLCLGIFTASVFSTLGFTTAGNALIYGVTFWEMLVTRLPQWAVMMPVYCVIMSLLYFCPLTKAVKSFSAGSIGRTQTGGTAEED